MTELDKDGDVIDWRSIASSFYHACGGMHGGGDYEEVDALVNHYQSYFEEEDEDESDE